MPLRDSRFENFVSGPNHAVVNALKHMPDEPGSNIFLYGGEGSGKTHLLNALCVETRERQGRAFYLALKRLPKDAIASLQGLEKLDLVCVDDLHVIAGDRPGKRHCFIVSTESGKPMAGCLSVAVNDYLHLTSGCRTWHPDWPGGCVCNCCHWKIMINWP